MRVLKRIKPLLVLFAICWTIEGVGMFAIKDMECHPMPGQYMYEIN